jgi:signal peptidase I
MMAASVAEYAATANEQRGPSPRVAALLSLLTPGLGHVYIGQARLGIALAAGVIAADALLVFAMMGVLARFWMFAVSLALLLALWLLIIVDAASRARRTPTHAHYSRWAAAPAFLLAWVAFAGLCVYAVHAKAAGRLLWFNAITPSMAPTLRAGEIFLADATYYQSRAPMRGEVAVYVHPKQPNVHYIKRIVAVEGDRIAIKDGRAVVNGMVGAEPYVDAGDPNGPFANMAELRVPAGHVFVLGDNRGESVDSRDTVAHGPVPVANLIGRVTDIAFSYNLARLGRWIGTPSNM